MSYHDINGTTKQKKKQKGQKIVGIKRYQKPTLRECKILSFNCLRKLRSEFIFIYGRCVHVITEDVELRKWTLTSPHVFGLCWVYKCIVVCPHSTRVFINVVFCVICNSFISKHVWWCQSPLPEFNVPRYHVYTSSVNKYKL
jgi:hypothetical protein